MKCMVLEKYNAPLVLKERENPVPDAGEAVIKVGACGVCRTDLKLWQGKMPVRQKLPIIPGHEVAGKIVDVGKGVDTSYVGKNAIVYTYLFCGTCEFCLSGRENLCSNLRGTIGLSEDGGYAEYLKAPLENLFFIPGGIRVEEAAIIPDAVATCYHALTSKAKVQPGKMIAVIGAGGLGLHAIQIAKAFGATVIAVDTNRQALAIAHEMGAEKGVEAGNNHEDIMTRILDFSGGRGVDAVIECSGDPGMEMLALNILRIAGRFVAVGYTPDKPFQALSGLLVSKELEIYGSRSKSRDDLKKTIDLVASSKVKPFIGETHPLAEANLVLKKLERGDIVGRSVLIP